MSSRAQTLPSLSVPPGRLVASFFVRNCAMRVTLDGSHMDGKAVTRVGWVVSERGPGLRHPYWPQHALFVGENAEDWQLVTSGKVLPLAEDAAAPLAGVVAKDAVKHVAIGPLALRSPLEFAAGKHLTGDAVRTQALKRTSKIAGGRPITLQLSRSTAGKSNGVFADAFMLPMFTRTGEERRSIYGADGIAVLLPRATPRIQARVFASIMHYACDFVESSPEVRFDVSTKLRQRTFGNVYVDGAGVRVFVLGLPTREGIARFRVQLTPLSIEALDERTGQ